MHTCANPRIKKLKQVGYKVGKVGIWTFAIVYEYEMHIREVHNLWLMCIFWNKVFWNVKIEHLFKNIFHLLYLVQMWWKQFL
jgi:hypothetical protein